MTPGTALRFVDGPLAGQLRIAPPGFGTPERVVALHMEMTLGDWIILNRAELYDKPGLVEDLGRPDAPAHAFYVCTTAGRRPDEVYDGVHLMRAGEYALDEAS